MKDPFLGEQWRELNARLKRCASHIAGTDETLAAKFAEQAAAFAGSDPPQRYPIFLDRVREAATIAVQWQELRDAQTSQRRASDAEAEPEASAAAESAA